MGEGEGMGRGRPLLSWGMIWGGGYANQKNLLDFCVKRCSLVHYQFKTVSRTVGRLNLHFKGWIPHGATLPLSIFLCELWLRWFAISRRLCSMHCSGRGESWRQCTCRRAQMWQLVSCAVHTHYNWHCNSLDGFCPSAIMLVFDAVKEYPTQ